MREVAHDEFREVLEEQGSAGWGSCETVAGVADVLEEEEVPKVKLVETTERGAAVDDIGWSIYRCLEGGNLKASEA